MTKITALEVAKELAEKAHKLHSGSEITAWSGTSDKEAQLHKLRKTAAETVAAIGTEQPYTQIMKKHEELAAQIDSAGLTGLISENDLKEYYDLLDKLWASIEREKNEQ